ncbi:class I SAM-dependent methyltransferase [Actinopolymorpha singaporensis]|uniref:Methyltransferase domain-containing protein n=1 Tax=Actinopolymorpha singaporensis TaxID=117157 RepID=A0A1H1Y930_9ACTN|nr:class I SAM-dependent methyltransferase [Actinopolymorpha singaporensis]SDT17759.1 Methyltransferase domain-containing protein [Actinopolymorpha singaporensis]
MPDLPLTGERTMPGIWHETYWFARHVVGYDWAAGLLAAELAGPTRTAPPPRVLDAGCGEGYGAQSLYDSLGAEATVVGVDYDAAAAAHAAATYPGVRVVRGNLVQLPFADRAFGAVVSLQTIEHLWNQPAFVAECARVTEPGGLLAWSTPNHLTFPPGNICHARELTAPELRALVERFGPDLELVTMTGLRHGPRIEAWERRHGDLVKAQLAHGPAAWSAELATFVTSLTAADFVLSEDDLDSSLDLLVHVRVRG